MCGIAGIINIKGNKLENINKSCEVLRQLIAHRGPDDSGQWSSSDKSVALVHKRLAIIDLSRTAAQPMRCAESGTTLVFNGEIYNYIELLKSFKKSWNFKSKSDTECILAAYDKYGTDCLKEFRGMFSFSLWDEKNKKLFCARDRFGIKPFYYAQIGDLFVFASEAKVLLPFLPEIETDSEAMAEYLSFQYTIGEHTLFKGIKQLLPGHSLTIQNSKVKINRYWDVKYSINYDHSPSYFSKKLQELLYDSVALHLRSDVPIGSYVSGGIDSSLIAVLAKEANSSNGTFFHGKFTEFSGYDESVYARELANENNGTLYEVDIIADDFRQNIHNVIYHLDFPVAGPGSFSQYMVSKLASKQVKVVLGGQGGDEIFGGYARYLLAYFEQCIKAAIDGTYQNGNYVVTIESIIPNLGILREYKPLMRQFWKDGLFGELDERYFRLSNRSNDMKDEINWSQLQMEKVFCDFQSIFNNATNVGHEAYFDKMTNFDLKCLLPALLHVEDRMSMAHGLESRVPLLDHRLIEFVATIPADVKFEGGRMKHLLKETFKDKLPNSLLNRRDKMGFPVPFTEWFNGTLNDMLLDTFHERKAKERQFINSKAIIDNFKRGEKFSRKIWGLYGLELWHQMFHDKAFEYRSMLK